MTGDIKHPDIPNATSQDPASPDPAPHDPVAQTPAPQSAATPAVPEAPEVAAPADPTPTAPPSDPPAAAQATATPKRRRAAKAQPWSVKGVSDTARKAARDAADAAGLSVGQWINQVITAADQAPGAAFVPAAPTTTDGSAAPPDAPAPPQLLPRVADAVAALETRVGDAQANISHTFAPIRESLEVIGVRVSALERIGDIAPGGCAVPTREAFARRLSGQSAAEAKPANQKQRQREATPFDDVPPPRRSWRRATALAVVSVLGISAAATAVWFSLLDGPGSARRLAASLPVERLTAVAEQAAPAAISPADLAAVRRQAEAGNAGAQLDLAGLYLAGSGVDQDYPTAAHWLTQAANNGLAEAQYSLGLLYERGLGVGQSADRAAEWFERAANQQYAQAEYALGIAYLEGRGKPQDYQDAATWLERAARQDHGDAQYAFAVIIEDGLIADPDPRPRLPVVPVRHRQRQHPGRRTRRPPGPASQRRPGPGPAGGPVARRRARRRPRHRAADRAAPRHPRFRRRHAGRHPRRADRQRHRPLSV